MSADLLIDAIGWLGTVIYLIAYFLVSTKRVAGDSIPYQGMNIAAGLMLVVNTFYWRAYPSLGLNAAWIGIGLYTLSRRSARHADQA